MSLVAVGCPVRQRSWILPQYVDALPSDAERIFILNGDEADQTQSREILAPAQFLVMDPPDDGPYGRLAALRNALVYAALTRDVDYLFSVDSDIILPEGALEKLMDRDLPAVAALVNNVGGGAVTPNGRWWPNAGALENDSYRPRTDIRPNTGLHKVQVSGAAVLLRRDALEKIHYAPHRFGEDIPASLSIGGLWLDSEVACEHVMLDPNGRHIR